VIRHGNLQNIFRLIHLLRAWSASKLPSTNKTETVISVVRDDSIVASYSHQRPLVLVFADENREDV
jgi:hypothetical protein